LRKSNPISRWDDFHIEGFAVLFFLLGLSEPWFFLVLAIYMLFTRKKVKWILMIGLFSVVFVRFYLWMEVDVPDRIHGEVKVDEIIKQDTYDVLIVRYQGVRYKLNTGLNLYIHGDILYLNGEVKPFRTQTIPFGFDQELYYLSKNIKGYVKIEEIRKVDHETSIFSIRNALGERIADHQSSIYLKALILGEKAFDDEQNDLFGELGILYLFSVSGMHIYMLLLIMKKIFFYLSLKKGTQDMLTLLIYLVFLYLNGFTFGVMRLIIMFIFKWINERYELELTKLDGIQITFFLMVVLNIHWIFHQGVLITYLILNMLYLTEFLYQGQKGYLKRLLMSTLIFLVILPFSNQVSLLVILTLPLLIMILSGPVFLFSICVILVPELDSFFNVFILQFEFILNSMNQKNFSIHLPHLESYMILIYYAALIYLLRSRTLMSVMKRSLIIFMILSSPFIKFSKPDTTYMYFLDVGQGDSIYIENQTCKLMIDSFKYTKSFLKNRGVYTLDYLILTHSDDDHIRESTDILKEISVDMLILSAYIDDYPSYTVPKSWLKAGDALTCGNIELTFLSPLKRYLNRNLNSLVFQMEVNDRIFLFTGDIEEVVEEDLVNHYGNLLHSDVLKVAHHGSDTSTSKNFLHHVNPSVAVISVGYENRFDFPSQTVLQRLYENNVVIYRTDLQGTILFTSDKKKEKWSVYIPFWSRI